MNRHNKISDLASGRFILDHLERFGSKLDQKHPFTFWLYFPTRELAEKATERAIKSGFKVEISYSDFIKTNLQWLCLLY